MTDTQMTDTHTDDPLLTSEQVDRFLTDAVAYRVEGGGVPLSAEELKDGFEQLSDWMIIFGLVASWLNGSVDFGWCPDRKDITVHPTNKTNK